jgi:molybdenum cofactor cytidylyltransferase
MADMISAIVLAAGASRRMGRPKPLISLGGRTILQHVLDHLRAADVDEIVVVLGHRAEDILPTLRGMRCRVVINYHYALGMSSSIQRGLQVVHPRAGAVLVALGDQPYVRPDVINRLLRAFRRNYRSIVVPTFGGQRGHPVLFGRKVWPRLLNLRGDVGGKKLLRRHPEDVFEVEVDDRGVLLDLDRPEDADRKASSGDAGEVPRP